MFSKKRDACRLHRWDSGTDTPQSPFQMVRFQSRNLGEDILGSEKMKITPLGAGSEVGRSCIVAEFKGKTIMVIRRGSYCFNY